MATIINTNGVSNDSSDFDAGQPPAEDTAAEAKRVAEQLKTRHAVANKAEAKKQGARLGAAKAEVAKHDDGKHSIEARAKPGDGTGIAALAAKDAIIKSNLAALAQILDAPPQPVEAVAPEQAAAQALAAFQPLNALLGKAGGGATESALQLGPGGLPAPMPSLAKLLALAASPIADAPDVASVASLAGVAVAPDPEIAARVRFAQRVSKLMTSLASEQLSPDAIAAAKTALGQKAFAVLQPFAARIPELVRALGGVRKMRGADEVNVPAPALAAIESALSAAVGEASEFAAQVRTHSGEVLPILQRHLDGDTTAIAKAPAALQTLVRGVMRWNEKSGSAFPAMSASAETAAASTTITSTTTTSTPATNAPDTSSLLSSVNFSTMDIDALMFVVMTEAANEDSNELQDQMKQLQATDAQKEGWRKVHEAQAQAQNEISDSLHKEYQARIADGELDPSVTYDQYAADRPVHMGTGYVNPDGSWGYPPPELGPPPPIPYAETPAGVKAKNTPPESAPQVSSVPPLDDTTATGLAQGYNLTASDIQLLYQYFANLPADQKKQFADFASFLTATSATPPVLVPGLKAGGSYKDNHALLDAFITHLTEQNQNPPGHTNLSGDSTGSDPTTETPAEWSDDEIKNLTTAQLQALMATDPNVLSELSPDQIGKLSAKNLQTIMQLSVNTLGSLSSEQLQAVMGVLIGADPSAQKGIVDAISYIVAEFPALAPNWPPSMQPPHPVTKNDFGPTAPPAKMTWGQAVNLMLTANSYQWIGDTMEKAGCNGLSPFSDANNDTVHGWGDAGGVFCNLLGAGGAMGTTFALLAQQCSQNASLCMQHSDDRMTLGMQGFYGLNPYQQKAYDLDPSTVVWMVQQNLDGDANNGFGQEDYQSILKAHGGTGGGSESPMASYIRVQEAALAGAAPPTDAPTGGGDSPPVETVNEKIVDAYNGLSTTDSQTIAAEQQRAAAKAAYQNALTAYNDQMAAEYGASNPLNQTGTSADLTNQLSASQDQVDAMGDLGQTQQMSLQLAMDRYSKIMEALSNIMKKMSDTRQTIVDNLK